MVAVPSVAGQVGVGGLGQQRRDWEGRRQKRRKRSPCSCLCFWFTLLVKTPE